MAATHYDGPVLVGDQRYAVANQAGTRIGPNQGRVVLEQTFETITQDSTTAVSKTIYLPIGCRILGFIIKIDVAFNSGSSATLSIGTAAAGVQYLTSADVKTAAGLLPLTATHVTGTQSANWASTSVAAMVATVTPSGATSAGTVNVTVVYSMAATDLP